METEKLATLMNDLATINLERATAYENASFQNHLFDVELRTTFALLANQSRQNNNLLNVTLEKILAKTAGTRPATGPLYEEWKNHTGYFTGENRRDLLSSCEAGELIILGIYEKALEQPLKPEPREMLLNQLRGLQSSLSTIKKNMDTGGGKSVGKKYQ